MTRRRRVARNSIAQYDEFAGAWGDPRGPLAMLHWLASARAERIPPAPTPEALLVDVCCGGGLMAPHVRALGYRHLGVDLSASNLAVARTAGVEAARADARLLPIADGVADVVVAGEALEHVPGLPVVVAEICRVLRPGGLLIADTIADTALARLLAVTIAERLPGGAPKGIHDPALFVDRKALIAEAARHGVRLELTGLRPSLRSWVGWARGRRETGRIVTTRPTSVLFLARGSKDSGDRRPDRDRA